MQAHITWNQKASAIIKEPGTGQQGVYPLENLKKYNTDINYSSSHFIKYPPC
jgi:hypothetical protein